jgi:hypothetical protein
MQHIPGRARDTALPVFFVRSARPTINKIICLQKKGEALMGFALRLLMTIANVRGEMVRRK